MAEIYGVVLNWPKYTAEILRVVLKWLKYTEYYYVFMWQDYLSFHVLTMEVNVNVHFSFNWLDHFWSHKKIFETAVVRGKTGVVPGNEC